MPLNDRPPSLDPHQLGYASSLSDTRKGASRPTRVCAAVIAFVLVALTVYFVWRSRYTRGGMIEWLGVIAVSSGGSAFCLLVSLGLVGRHKKGNT